MRSAVPCGCRRATACEGGARPAAYLALPGRCVRHPDRDVMAIWSARSGWKVVLENTSRRPSTVLARLADATVPPPAVVESFVRDVLSGAREGGVPAPSVDAAALGDLLVSYVVRGWPEDEGSLF
ncbi:DUF6292 family protein [Amycolatopsis sp. NPDC051903]|uniref:DUF6292 family protein n=1 Tax=Amycolatopsis sp. NPDC051903 TaxID=3363936 RepID=UPI0037A0361C